MEASTLKVNEDLGRLIQAPSPAHRALLSFNFIPLEYAHMDWLKKTISKDYDAAIHVQVLRSEIAGHELNFLLQKKMKLEASVDCYQLKSFAMRVALLPGDILVELLENIGLLFYIDEIKKMINRNDVKEIQTLIGQERYTLFLKRIPFLFSDSFLKKVQRRRMPAFNIKNLKANAQKLGHFYFDILLSQESIAVQKRVRLKFSANESWDFAFKANPRYAFDKLELLFQKMVREAFPQWQHLFV